MRADRLLAMLMLLQARGRLTAQQLATELEVSERTIYRDVDALSMAGVPVYAERGPGGGVALLDNYRTSLTGLTEAETRALFTLSIPAPLADLGLADELRSALRKLAAAIPEHGRDAGQHLRQRIHVDAGGWAHFNEPTPYLSALHDAIMRNAVLSIRYQVRWATEITQQIHPFGLVAKAGAWFVVYRRTGRVDVLRVARIRMVAVTGDTFERPPDFDLAVFWGAWCDGYGSPGPEYIVRARVAPELLPELRWVYGTRLDALLADDSVSDAQGWHVITLPFADFEAARRTILSWGRAIEVLEPRALRCSVLDFAQQIVAFYGERVCESC